MDKFKENLENFIKSQDEIVQPKASDLHFSSNYKQKTFVGGIASMLVTLYVLSMVYTNGLKMVQKDKNTYKSLEEQMDYYIVGEPTL